jgi:hypothetical protein
MTDAAKSPPADGFGAKVYQRVNRFTNYVAWLLFVPIFTFQTRDSFGQGIKPLPVWEIVLHQHSLEIEGRKVVLKGRDTGSGQIITTADFFITWGENFRSPFFQKRQEVTPPAFHSSGSFAFPLPLVEQPTGEKTDAAGNNAAKNNEKSFPNFIKRHALFFGICFLIGFVFGFFCLPQSSPKAPMSSSDETNQVAANENRHPATNRKTFQ